MRRSSGSSGARRNDGRHNDGSASGSLTLGRDGGDASGCLGDGFSNTDVVLAFTGPWVSTIAV